MIRREANERGVTVLITTHIINDIEKVTEDVCILQRGRIVMHEDLEVLREQVFVVETREPIDVPDTLQILRQETENSCTYWLRDITGTLTETTLPAEIHRQRTNLEEIYLAVTKTAADRMAGISPLAVDAG